MSAWRSGGQRVRIMSKKKKDRYDKSVYRSLALVMQFGINMLVPICMLSALGIYLDQRFGTSYIMVILFFVGAVAGGQNVYRMAKNIFEEPREEQATDNCSTAEKTFGTQGDGYEGNSDAQKGR